MDFTPIIIGIVSLVAIIVLINIIKSILDLRVIVPTDEVHIVQSSKSTVSYGSRLDAGDVSSGMNSALDIFSAKGGTQIGTMLQGLANTPVGKEVLKTVGIETDDKH